MRLSVQGALTVRSFDSEPIDFSSHVVEALRPKKETITRMQDATLQANEVMEVRMCVLRGKVEVLAPAFRIEPVFGGNGLKQGRFSGAILTDEEGDRRVKFQPVQMPDRWNAEGVRFEAGDFVAFKSDRLKERLFNDVRHLKRTCFKQLVRP